MTFEPNDRLDRFILVGRLAERTVALPGAAVERVLRMAAVTPFPGAPEGVVGVLNVHGAVLPVVDPRSRLQLSTPPFQPDQQLVIVRATSRYLLWLDRVEQVISVPPSMVDAVDGDVLDDRKPVLAPHIVRLDGALVPVLAPEAFDPGPLVQTNRVMTS